jgi:very-short-patch-repair endonuclease
MDLEIDGKQHKEPDRLEHDKERDEYITTELGFIVYRIPWNEVNTEKGRTKMKEKVDKFFEFYNSL